MTASADKVQFLLQSSLQQTLPLVKKGIFSEQQLRQVMLQRQKHQNKLYSSTYKLSHYLKAIEFEYDLERQRLYRIKNQEEQNVNPLFRKQGKTDFSIVKRIIKLWDRTMHKYRFRTYLWKQYLAFCISIKSKKHFYKALTNALRFLPFQVQLWKIGVRYEVEVGRNLWKARKLFHKALKLVNAGQKSIQLTKELIKFELQFVQMLQSRQKIIQGQEQQGKNDMKFIIGENNEHQESSHEQNQGALMKSQGTGEHLRLRQYDGVLYVALLDSIQKNYKSLTYFQNREHLSAQERSQSLCDLYLKFLNQLLESEENQLIEHIVGLTAEKLTQYKQEFSGVKLEEKYQDEEVNQMEVQEEQNAEDIQHQGVENVLIEEASEHCLLIEEEKQVKNVPQIHLSKEETYANEILQTYQETSKFDDKKFNKSLKQLCLKPLQLSSFLQRLLPHFFAQSLDILRKNEWLRIPLNSLEKILIKLNQSAEQQGNAVQTVIAPFMQKQFQRINPLQYITHVSLLREVITFNKQLGKIEENNRFFRSLLVNCKHNIEFVERAKGLFVL